MTEKKRLMVSLTLEQIEKVEAVAKEMGISKSALVAIALGEMIARREYREREIGGNGGD